MPKRVWTLEEENQLMELYNQGFKRPEIAKKLNKSLEKISHKIYILKDPEAYRAKQRRYKKKHSSKLSRVYYYDRQKLLSEGYDLNVSDWAGI